MKKSPVSRRKFIQDNAALLAGVPLLASMPESLFGNTTESLRIGVIGPGSRGRYLMNTLQQMGGVVTPAICDISQQSNDEMLKICAANGLEKPKVFMGAEAYKKMLDEVKMDAVIIATPWDLHAPMSVYAMNAGVAVGCEVPIAYTLEDCWQLIETHEKTGVPCMQLENWSFRSDNLAILNMIRAGLFGTMTHAHCAYSHDCADHWFFEAGTGNSRWGAQFLVDHNRSQYPTHQQGPVLSWLDINRSDTYDTITSTASDPVSIYEYFQRHFPDHPNGKRKYKQGDIVTSVVRTKKGKTIVINNDMQSPRPYDNRWTVQGSKGIYNEQRDAIYLTGVSPKYHAWEDFPPYHEQYKHPWAQSTFGGHGGADGIMLTQFVKALREKRPFPLDLYDGVLMAAVGPLSEMSIAGRSKLIQVPDFTKGRWETNRPYFAMT